MHKPNTMYRMPNRSFRPAQFRQENKMHEKQGKIAVFLFYLTVITSFIVMLVRAQEYKDDILWIYSLAYTCFICLLAIFTFLDLRLEGGVILIFGLLVTGIVLYTKTDIDDKPTELSQLFQFCLFFQITVYFLVLFIWCVLIH